MERNNDEAVADYFPAFMWGFRGKVQTILWL